MSRPADPNSPVRSDDRPGPRVTAVLESLALQRASGVLEIDGNPAGVVYLDRGQVTYAQASWVPDLAARFCATQRPPADVRALLLSGDADGYDLGARQLGGRDLGSVLLGCASRAELQALLRSVIVDAVLALTVPLSGDAAVSGLRFEAPRPHWASAFVRLPLDSVREEAVCRAARLARYQVTRTTRVSLRDLDQPAMVLTRDQWAIASRIGRTSTVRDLAWRSGLALYDTIECVGRLVRAGVCTLAPASTPAVASSAGEARSSAGAAGSVTGAARPSASTPSPVSGVHRPSAGPGGSGAGGSGPAAAVPVAGAERGVGPEPGGAVDDAERPVMLPAPGLPEPLPRRQPGTHLARELREAADEAPSGITIPRPAHPDQPTFTPPPPDVLHRLLEGLRNLT